MSDSLITEEARAWLGRVWEYPLGTVTARDVARFARAIGDDDPRFFEPADEDGVEKPVAEAPVLFLQSMFIWDEGPEETALRDDGVPKAESGMGAFAVPLPLKRVMGGGYDVYPHAPVLAGDVFRVRLEIVDMYEKQMSIGPCVVVVDEQRFVNQRDEVALVVRATHIMY